MPSSVDFAREVIAGRVPAAAEALQHAQVLTKDHQFDLAHVVLAAAAAGLDPADPLYPKVHQQWALTTYKDKDLPSPHRLHEALEILRRAFNLETTVDTETLGLAGAIYKLLWQDGGQRVHIEKSYAHYRRAHDLAPRDDGYVSVNAAYLLDVLASQEAKGLDPLKPAEVEQRFQEAARIRTDIITRLQQQGGPAKKEPGDAWWYWASLAEAALGVGRYDEARNWLVQGKGTQPPPQAWMIETTARQMAAVARIHHERHPGVRERAYDVLREALGLSAEAIESVFIGKVGLALSGGGFRASLYHIGVMAKLAELDVLRHVEVLSCVSGGSIVGAAYYLALKQQLEAKPVLSQQDYIDVVQKVEEEFLTGVQRNIRMRIASSWWASLKMAFVPGYTRTTRTGELYERELYERIDHVDSRSVDQLMIRPPGYASAEAFKPKYENWLRSSKVPLLVLNATALNSGHNWQFTATWMGESPQAIGKAIDSVPRLRRLWYTEPSVPAKWRHVPLGSAVGSSAAVPGIFEPIVVDRLYPDRTVRLADGGVHDNQGLASLIEQECKVILVSDASGQMEEQNYPKGDVAGVLGRTNGILQARVREAQYNDLQTRDRSGAIDGMMFIHLTKDLESDPVSWIGAPKKTTPTKPRTSYGIDREIQKELAEVRTDLDSFSDAEAYALMTSGYLMAEYTFVVERCAPTIPLNPASAYWRFLGAKDALTQVDKVENARMLSLLGASKMLALKVWTQSKVLVAAKRIGFAAVIVGLIALFALNWTKPIPWWVIAIPTYERVAIALGVLALALLIRYGTDKWLHIQKRFDEFFIGIGLLAATPLVWLHLSVFDQIFLWIGEWKDAPQPPAPPAFAPPGGPRIPIKGAPPAANAPGRARQRSVVHRMLHRVRPLA